MSVSPTLEQVASQEISELSMWVNSARALPAEELSTKLMVMEAELQEGLFNIGRQVYAELLSRLDVNAPGIVVDGQRYRRKQCSNGKYQTMMGEVTVVRTTYVPRGGNAGPSVAPWN